MRDSGAAQPEQTFPVVLTGASREALDALVAEQVKKNDGKTLVCGPIGRSKTDGAYVVRIDMLN